MVSGEEVLRIYNIIIMYICDKQVGLTRGVVSQKGYYCSACGLFIVLYTQQLLVHVV